MTAFVQGHPRRGCLFQPRSILTAQQPTHLFRFVSRPQFFYDFRPRFLRQLPHKAGILLPLFLLRGCLLKAIYSVCTRPAGRERTKVSREESIRINMRRREKRRRTWSTRDENKAAVHVGGTFRAGKRQIGKPIQKLQNYVH